MCCVVLSMEQKSLRFSFPSDPITYLCPSWSDLTNYCCVLTDALKDTSYDMVVSLAKGGWPLSRMYADCAGVRELYSLGVKFYTGIDEQAVAPVVYQDIDPILIQGKTILLFDDIADSGHSLRFAASHLLSLGAQKVMSVVIYYKPRSVVKPDYYCAETTDWVIFPFEVFETCQQLSQRWAKLGIPEKTQHDYLLRLGIAEQWISKYQKEVDKHI